MKNIIIILMMLFCGSVQAQSQLDKLLQTIEANNMTLQAARELTRAQSLTARTGRSLQNPTIAYDRMWGSPSALGKSGEFRVQQGFDFPTVYTSGNALARMRIAQYGQQYAVERQQILLQAKMAYISLVAQQELRSIADARLSDAQAVASSAAKRFEAGDINILEKNRADLELVFARNKLLQVSADLASMHSRIVGLNAGLELEIVPAQTYSAELLTSERPDPIAMMVALYKQSDPQMKLLHSEHAVAAQDVKVSRAMSLPKFELGYRREFATGEHFDGVTMGMSIPMFGNKNNVKRAKAQQVYSEQLLRSAEIDVETRLSELYQSMEMAENALKEFANILSPRSNVEILNRALSAGQISVNEYYMEYETLNRIREGIISSQREYLLACAQINAIKL